MLQHRVVVEVRRAAQVRGWSVKTLAIAVNEHCPRHRSSADTMRRKFRGEASASCEDLIAWLLVVGAQDPVLTAATSSDRVA